MLIQSSYALTLASMAIGISGLTLASLCTQISATKNKTQISKRVRPPIFISTNPSHVNLHDLSDLFNSSNFSCHRFPSLDPDGRVEPTDIDKLRIALSHSSVLVSVFCKPQFTSEDGPKDEVTSRKSGFVFGELFERAVPVTESNGQLVGFGRAVSDCGLTASIYDVVVNPSLQGVGIGRMIVRRLVRVLTSRGIYDIVALCSEKQRFLHGHGWKV
ncbi:uncharacterized protein LOC122650586 isoform X2 [Telopea speciosissima]|uniref:uncharacterized protein LOC122650586 isoform X2 n=1 Tax=Telopea speciosissima TaxID=54955 RepID=UPI001CC47BEA|nr:uncharacterized protein LOC122650586 isoform X2 [Telopea speciosissima]